MSLPAVSLPYQKTFDPASGDGIAPPETSPGARATRLAVTAALTMELPTLLLCQKPVWPQASPVAVSKPSAPYALKTTEPVLSSTAPLGPLGLQLSAAGSGPP